MCLGVRSFFLDGPANIFFTQNIILNLCLSVSEHDYVLMCSSVTFPGLYFLK